MKSYSLASLVLDLYYITQLWFWSTVVIGCVRALQ